MSRARGQEAARAEQEEWAAQGLSPNDPWVLAQVADVLESLERVQGHARACAEDPARWNVQGIEGNLGFYAGYLSQFD